MKIKIPLQMKGHYHLELTRNGKVIQEADFHNIILWQAYRYFYNNSTSAHTKGFGGYLMLGSGTTTPNMNQTGMASKLWDIPVTSAKILSTTPDRLTRTWQYTYKVPANSSYVGTIREIGITIYRSSGSYATSYLGTRALVVDSEGNPIEIQKTYMDELTVTVELTITRPSYKTGMTFDFNGAAFYTNYPACIFTNYTNTILLSPIFSTTGNPLMGLNATKYTSMSWNETDKTHSCSAEWSGDVAWQGNYNPGQRSYINSAHIGDYHNGSNSGSTRNLRVLFPNADIFPVRTLENLSLGTGDGATTDFTPILPAWMENTEKVYKNGVELVRGVDYLANHIHNRQRHISVELGVFLEDVRPTKMGNDGYGYIWGAYSDYYQAYRYIISKDNPVIISYATDYAFSTKANYYVLGDWYCITQEYPTGNLAVVYSYSADGGNTYTEFGRINPPAVDRRYLRDRTLRTMEEVSGITHVKIELETDNANLQFYHDGPYGRLGYQGEYAIRFLTPPAEGDILTMDCDIDRPWKDENTIIQWNPIIQW